MLTTAWCLKIKSLAFTNLLLTHVYTGDGQTALPIFVPSSVLAGTFVATQSHFLTGIHTASKGKIGISQPLSLPNPFHLQEILFSSHLI